MLLLFFTTPGGGPGPEPTPDILGDLLRISTLRMRLVADQQVSGLGGGQILVADLAPKHWEFEITLINMEGKDVRKVQALIEALDEGMNSFFLYDPRAAYPITDAGGLVLGASEVKIASLDGSDSRFLSLKGLPAGYVLSIGDMLSFDFGTPSKRALHRIVAGGTADGTGVTPALEVRPHILPGAAVDAVVNLKKPSARVKIVPGTFDPGTARQMLTSGMGFKARQVLV